MKLTTRFEGTQPVFFEQPSGHKVGRGQPGVPPEHTVEITSAQPAPRASQSSSLGWMSKAPAPGAAPGASMEPPVLPPSHRCPTQALISHPDQHQTPFPGSNQALNQTHRATASLADAPPASKPTPPLTSPHISPYTPPHTPLTRRPTGAPPTPRTYGW